MIYESKDLSCMYFATLFGKLQEHKMELKNLVENEEGEKNKKSLVLKVT